MALGNITVDFTPATEDLLRFGHEVEVIFAQGLQLWAEGTMTLAKSVYTPVVTGNLRSSGYVTQLIPNPDGWELEMGFGGAATAYAKVVHERPASVGQGKNKYLEKAIKERLPSLEPMLAAWLKKNLA